MKGSIGQRWNVFTYLRRATLVGLGATTAVSVSWLITSVSASNSLRLGYLARESILTLFLAGLFFLCAVTDWEEVVPALRERQLNTAQVTLIVSVAFALAYAIIGLGSNISPTHFLLGILPVAIGTVTTTVLAVTSTGVYGIMAFVITLPFLSFLEWSFRDTFTGGGYVGFLTISPSILFVWVFFFASAIGDLLHNLPRRNSKFDRYLLIWGGCVLLSALASRNPLQSVRQFSLEFLVFPLFYLVIQNRARTKEDLVLVCKGLIAYGVLRLSIVYYFLVAEGHLSVGRGLGEGLMGHIPVSGVLTSIAILLLCLSTSFLFLSHRKSRTAAWICLLLLSGAIVLNTERRADTMGLVAGGLIWLLVVPRRRRFLMTVTLLAAVIAIAYPLVFPVELVDSFSRWGSLEALLVDQAVRWDAWQAAVSMTRDYPLLGIGPGMWGEYLPHYTQRAFYTGWFAENRVYINQAHSLFLNYASASGLPAAIALFLFVVAIGRRMILSIPTAQDQAVRVLGGGLLWCFSTYVITAAIGGTSFHTEGFSEQWRITIDVGMLFWLLAGACAAWLTVANDVQ